MGLAESLAGVQRRSGGGLALLGLGRRMLTILTYSDIFMTILSHRAAALPLSALLPALRGTGLVRRVPATMLHTPSRQEATLVCQHRLCKADSTAAAGNDCRGSVALQATNDFKSKCN